MTVDDDPVITYNEVKLKNSDLSSSSIANPSDPNDISQPRDVIWANDLTLDHMTAKVTTKYTPAVNASIDPPSADGSAHYVTDYRAGIIQGVMTYVITNGKAQAVWYVYQMLSTVSFQLWCYMKCY